MCFKNLPVEFDATGRPYLRQGWETAYNADANAKKLVGHGATPPQQPDPARVQQMVATQANIQEFNVDPVTRIAGALALHTVADLQERKMVESRSMATLFRGYEIILQGRDPRDAIFISSRACGVCGGVHAVTSAYCLDMAFDVVPPPLGTVVRNLLLAAEFLYDQTLIFLLGMVHFCQSAIGEHKEPTWNG